ncbi:MAG: hypothetical protein CSA79_01855 [Thiothrix nivea]|nr:MAG: hypothetical protein CSA79_01855 [Thiothrix nivea]
MLVKGSRLGIPLRRYYFACQQRPIWWETLLPTAYFDCYQPQRPGKTFFTRTGYTLITDLNLAEEPLFSSLSRKTRNEIRRYQRGSDYVLQQDTPFTDFLPAYNQFAVRRGLSRFSAQDVDSYGRENLYLLSMARSGRAEIFDLYLCDPLQRYVTGLLSCSPIDDIRDRQQRRQLSIARRYLLWFAILHFKQAGFQVFDWGGYAPDDPNPVIRRISEFKLSFKGIVTPVYQHYSPTYWVIETVRDRVKGWRSGRAVN